MMLKQHGKDRVPQKVAREGTRPKRENSGERGLDRSQVLIPGRGRETIIRGTIGDETETGIDPTAARTDTRTGGTPPAGIPGNRRTGNPILTRNQENHGLSVAGNHRSLHPPCPLLTAKIRLPPR